MAKPQSFRILQRYFAIKYVTTALNRKSSRVNRQPPMFSPEQLADLLAMPFFAGLDPATLNQLMADLEPVHLRGGALLFASTGTMAHPNRSVNWRAAIRSVNLRY